MVKSPRTLICQTLNLEFILMRGTVVDIEKQTHIVDGPIYFEFVGVTN